MPIKRLATTPQPPPPEAPSLWDRLGGLAGVAGTGIRTGSGILASEGGLPGAAIAGGGEALAQAVEGSTFKPAALDPNSTLGKFQHSLDPGLEDSPTSARIKGFIGGAVSPFARIATAAGMGAVPFNSVLQEGKVLPSAIRGAGYSGVGEAGREFASGQELDPKAIGTSGALGGAVTGGFAKLLGGGAKGPSEAARREAHMASTRPWASPKPEGWVPPPTAAETAAKTVATRTGKMSASQQKGLNLQEDRFGTALGRKHMQARDADAAAIEAENKAAAKAVEEQLATEEIERSREGLVPGEPSVRTSYKAKVPGGQESATIKWEAPAKEKGGKWTEEGDEGPSTPLGDLLSNKGKIPPGRSRPNIKIDPNWQPPYGGTAAKPPVAPELPTLPTAAPEVPAIAPAEPPPTAKYVFDQPGVGPMFNVEGGPSHGSTKSAQGLEELGIPVPETPSTPPANVRKMPGVLYKESLATPPPPVTPESIASAKAAADAERIALEKANTFSTGMARPPAVTPPPPGIPRKPLPFTPKAPSEVEQAMEGAAAPIESAPENPLLQFFKTRVDAAGAGNRAIKAAKAAGEKVPEEGRAIAGKNLRKEAQAAGLPTGAKPPAPKVEPPVSVAPQAGAPDYPAIAAESPERIGKMDELEKLLKAQPQGPAGGSEKGAVNPALLAKLGLGLGGAAVGAATDPLNNRIESALAGGAAGVGIAMMPQLLSQLGAAPEALQGLTERIRTPEGLKEAAHKIWQTLPQVQRFNYLTSAVGLPANAGFGPYGSATFGALEHALAGDPRGWEVLKALNPISFAKEFKASLDEAAQLIGRAEGSSLSAAPNMTEKALALPGTAMTAGDVAARRFLERAGFTPDEARRMTLTGEPGTALGKNITRFGKSRTEGGKESALSQLMLPFKRTTMNILEQGAERTPLLGFLAQGAKDVPDSLKQQLIQQGMGGAIGLGSGALGANVDPETAKWLRRYVTNAAGQYSLPASIGFAAGQAIHAGKNPVTGAITNASGALPLPTAEPMVEWAKFITGNGPAPRGAIPGLYTEMTQGPAVSTPKPLPSIRRLR